MINNIYLIICTTIIIASNLQTFAWLSLPQPNVSFRLQQLDVPLVTGFHGLVLNYSGVENIVPVHSASPAPQSGLQGAVVLTVGSVP